MAKTPSRNSKAVRKDPPAVVAVVAPIGITSPPEPKHPLRVAVDAAFRNDATIREAITENLKSRSAKSQALADRVDAAFKHLHPNNLSTEERTRRHYVALTEPLAPVQEAVIEKGVNAIQWQRACRSHPALEIIDAALEEQIGKALAPA